MTVISVTKAQEGTTVANNGTLDTIHFVTPPTETEWFTLVDDSSGTDIVLWNMQTLNMPYPTGSDIAVGAGIPFINLTLRSISIGSQFDLTVDTVAPPVLTSLSPATAVSGDPEFTLSCIGTGFTSLTVINFAGVDEPTIFVNDTEVTTIVKPSLFAPATVPVYVRNGSQASGSASFTFT